MATPTQRDQDLDFSTSSGNKGPSLKKSGTMTGNLLDILSDKQQEYLSNNYVPELENDDWEQELKQQNTFEENSLRSNANIDDEDEGGKAKLRRNMTMSSNILPFIPKDNSELEKYATNVARVDNE